LAELVFIRIKLVGEFPLAMLLANFSKVNSHASRKERKPAKMPWVMTTTATNAASLIIEVAIHKKKSALPIRLLDNFQCAERAERRALLGSALRHENRVCHATG
jgi:hypothetical protein